MPSKSKKQHNLMAAVANNPKFAKKVGIPQSVGEDYVEADKGRKFRSGGMAGCGTKRMKAGGGITPMKKAPPKTALEQTSPKSAAALKALEKKQQELTMRNLDDEIYRIDTEKAMEKRKMNKMAAGGKVRGDGCAIRGRTKGRMV